MTIRVKFTEQDLVNAHMVIYFRKTYTRVLFGIVGLLFFSSLVLGLIYEKSLAAESLGYLVPVAILVGLQLILAKGRFRADRRYKQPVDYSFTDEGIDISGNSFDMLLPWASIKKIILTKNWILVRQKWKITAAIPRAAFWENEIEELKQLLIRKQVRSNL